MAKDKTKIATFSKIMSLEEAEREKKKPTPLGESLRRADQEYGKRRKK